jgi:hypothetical protein
MKSGVDEKTVLDGIADRVIKKWSVLKLPKPVVSDAVRSAQRFLNAAQESVSLTLLNFRLAREFTKAIDQKDARGRLSNSEMDLLRSAIVFAGAGLDTSLKELIRCGLPKVIITNELARSKFEDFASEHLGSKRGVIDIAALGAVLTSPDGARGALLKRYARALTGDSLQSAMQVSNASGALGISDSALRKRMTEGSTLDQMFRARNQIVHELDLTSTGPRFRKIDTTEQWVHEALSVGQEIINAVAGEIETAAV